MRTTRAVARGHRHCRHRHERVVAAHRQARSVIPVTGGYRRQTLTKPGSKESTMNEVTVSQLESDLRAGPAADRATPPEDAL